MIEQVQLMGELTISLGVAGSEIARQYAHRIDATKRRCLHNVEVDKAMLSLC
jgi:citrate lyase gamma subunit